MYEKVVELSPIPQKQPMGKNSPFTCIHKSFRLDFILTLTFTKPCNAM